MKRWLEQVRALPRDRRIVQHEPETARYDRARLRLEYLLEASSVLGVRPGDTPGAAEIAMWAPPPNGHGPGFYSCLRAYADESKQVMFAVLFCFWDGTEGSRGFRSTEVAQAYAHSEGFEDSDAEDKD